MRKDTPTGWTDFAEWARLREELEAQMPARTVAAEAAFLRFMQKLLVPPN